jgi:ribosomal protein L14E/L6E/L27E
MSALKNGISVGEIVQSLAGRDKGEYLVVLAIDGEYVIVANGKARKAQKPKRKKIKHIKKVSSVSEEFTEHILSGKPIGNERLLQAIKIAKQKIQEE